MALPEALTGDKWSNKTARTIFPLLVWCAQHEKTITYGEVDAEIQRRGWGNHVFHTVYGYAAGAVGSALLEIEKERGQKIPPLNALVVNAVTRIPGDGCDYYLKRYLNNRGRKSLNTTQRKAMAEETIAEVWRFEDWDDILDHCGLSAEKEGVPSLLPPVEPQKPKKSGWATGPESDAHKALKAWVATHPSAIKSKIAFKPGTVEWLFASSDRADVMFSHEDGCAAVEVKALEASDGELERGIYQCVKYQALIRAELKAGGSIPNGSAVLVTERRLPIHLQNLAGLLGVRVICVKR
jgi:hypothetical protein